MQEIFLISGVYDLHDLVKTYVNDAVKLPQESAVTLSPLSKSYRHLRGRKVRIYVIVGENESPAFKNQSKDFYELLIKDYTPVYTYLDIKHNYDHFDIVETLADENNYLKQLLIEYLTNISSQKIL